MLNIIFSVVCSKYQPFFSGKICFEFIDNFRTTFSHPFSYLPKTIFIVDHSNKFIRANRHQTCYKTYTSVSFNFKNIMSNTCNIHRKHENKVNR